MGGSVAVKLEDVGSLAPELLAHVQKGAGSPRVRPHSYQSLHAAEAGAMVDERSPKLMVHAH